MASLMINLCWLRQLRVTYAVIILAHGSTHKQHSIIISNRTIKTNQYFVRSTCFIGVCVIA